MSIDKITGLLICALVCLIFGAAAYQIGYQNGVLAMSDAATKVINDYESQKVRYHWEPTKTGRALGLKDDWKILTIGELKDRTGKDPHELSSEELCSVIKKYGH
jgi:hypothetical protein